MVTKEPRVTLLKQGVFNFNTDTLNIFKKQAVSHLWFLYDPETNYVKAPSS